MDVLPQTRQIESAKTYFEKVDKGEFPFELFTPDFEFFFPKYGVGRGPEAFREFAAGLWVLASNRNTTAMSSNI